MSPLLEPFDPPTDLSFCPFCGGQEVTHYEHLENLPDQSCCQRCGAWWAEGCGWIDPEDL